MGKLKVKTGVILFAYSIIMTFLFVVGIIVFLNVFYPKESTALPNLIAVTEEREIVKSIETGSNTVSLQSVISTKSIGDYYSAQLFNELPLVIVLFCICISIFTLMLWGLLNYINKKDTMRIVKSLNEIEDAEDIVNADPALKEVYLSLREKFSSHIEDYKKLNSYISHEQKNEIAILRTKIELNEDKELLHNLDKVTKSVEDILTISDTNVDKDVAPVDVAFICAEVCDDYSKLFNKITFDFDEDGNTTIIAKERWIYRAVSNIIDNAIKYGDNSEINVSVTNNKGSIIIKVKDSGIGIDSENVQKIFNNRFRINELNKDGYGIGLSLVRHVCDLCNGFVWVDSKALEGATFYLVFNEYNDENIH